MTFHEAVEEQFEEEVMEPLARDYFPGGMPEDLRRHLGLAYCQMLHFPELFGYPYESAEKDCRKYLAGRLGAMAARPARIDGEPSIGFWTAVEMIAWLRRLSMENVFFRHELCLETDDPCGRALPWPQGLDGIPSIREKEDYRAFVGACFNGVDPLYNEGYLKALRLLSCGVPVDDCPASMALLPSRAQDRRDGEGKGNMSIGRNALRHGRQNGLLGEGGRRLAGLLYEIEREAEEELPFECTGDE